MTTSLRLLNVIVAVATVVAWSLIWLGTWNAPGWGAIRAGRVMAPIVLTGVTIAFHRLLTGRREAWLYSAFLAGVTVILVLKLVAIVVMGLRT